jgi:hypothetical protein
MIIAVIGATGQLGRLSPQFAADPHQSGSDVRGSHRMKQ